MAHVILGTTMSLDGFINDRSGSVERLYPDLAALADTEMLSESMKMTGAVVMGRHAYEMANGDFTGYEYQVPIFVVMHDVPQTVAKGANEKLSFTFVSDGVESALLKAKAAAGDKDVTIVGGASIAQQALKTGLVDELHIGIVPVLFGQGLRFFEHLEDVQIELEYVKTLEAPGRVDLIFRIIK